MRLSRLVLLCSVLLGILLWVVDSLLDWLLFYDGSLTELAVTAVPAHELWVRSALVLLCVALGALLSWAVRGRERDARRIGHLNRVLTAIRDVNQLIVSEDDRDELLAQTCEILTATRGYHTAWILLTDDDGGSGRLYATGLGDSREAFERRLRQSPPLPCMTAVASGEHLAVFEDVGSHAPDCPLVTAYQHRAGHVAAIEHTGRQFGLIGVSLPSETASDLEEQQLFSEIAADLGMALGRIEALEQRTAAEAAQARADLRYETLIATMSDGVGVCDMNGRYTYVNDALAEMVGRDPEEMLGQPPGAFATEEARETFERRIQTRLTEGSSDTYETTLVRSDGQQFPVLLSAAAVRNENEEIVGGFAVMRDITDLKDGERQLKLLNRVLRNSPAVPIMWEIGPDWPVSFVSESVEQFGYSPQQFAGGGLNFVDVVHPDDLAMLTEEVERYIAEGEREFALEYRLITPDGETRWIADRTWVVRDAAGDPIRLQGVLVDITERKRAEEALAESEGRYREVVQNAHDIIYTLSDDGTITTINSAVEPILGFSPEELVGRKLSDILSEERFRIAREYYETKLAGDADTTAYEFELFSRCGDLVVLEISTTLRVEDGQPVEVIGIARDVTDRKRAEDGLAQSEERYRGLYNAMNEGVALHSLIRDGDGTPIDYEILDVNPAYERILGISAEEAIGRRASEAYPGDEPPLLEQYARVALDGASFTDEFYLEPLETHFHISAFQLQGNHFATVFEDISDRIRAQERLRRRTEDLNERVKEMRCLYQVARLTGQRGRPFDRILQEVTDMLPSSWRWPEVASACIEFDGQVYEAGVDGCEPVARQAAPITVNGEIVGQVIVRYHEERPDFDEGLFLAEERELIDTVAFRIGEMAERQQVESERESIARFPEENLMPVMRIAADGAVDYANDAAEAVLERLGSGVGRPAPQQWRRDIASAANSGGTRRIEVSVEGRDYTFALAPVVEHGYVNIYGMDITARKAAEEALSQSEKRFRRAIADAPFPIMLHAEDGEVITVNRAWTEITGYGPEELTTVADWLELAYGDQAPAIGEHTGKIYRMDAVSDQGEFEIRTAGGGRRAWHFHGAPLGELPDGRRLVMSIAADMTERRAAENALRESERRYRTVFENTGAATCLIAEDTTITLANEGFGRLAGAPRARIQGRISFTDFIAEHELDRMLGYHRARRDADGRAPNRYEFDFVTLGGEPRRVFMHIDVVPGTQTSVASLVDVTEVRRAQNELQALTDELEERVRDRTAQLQAANDELEAFAYSVSHDLRAPLRAIDGFSQAVVEDYADALDETGKNYLQRVRSASQRMGELIDDILQLSRITRSELNRDRVDMSQMAVEIVEELQTVEPDRSVEVTIEPDMTVDADRRLLRTALENLLENAWKYSSHEEQACIEFRSELDESGCRAYHVEDNGAGFNMQYSGKLFQPFQRLHRQDEFPGTGVGLATVRRIIRRHGGDIDARGAVGEGATFFFTLG